MKSLKAGAVLLSIWSGLNLVVAAVVTVMTVMGRSTPALALYFAESERSALDPKLVAIVQAQAAICNPCVVALCILVLAIVWTSLIARARWAFWALVGALVPLQAFGFVSDAFIGHRNLVANVVSTVILVTGLTLSDAATRRRTGVQSPPHR